MRLTCLVDNTVALGSALWGEHGLSFLIDTDHGNVLWDSGQTGTVLQHNLRELRLEGVTLGALALSHAHRDHTGGLEAVLEARPGLPIYAHETIFRERFSEREGKLRATSLAAKQDTLSARAVFRLHGDPQEIAPGVWTTGSIHPRPYPQGASRHHLMRQGGELVPDGYLDDLSLVLCVSAGIVLLCGCCHAGLRNTLAMVRRQYDDPLVAILGGTHLASADRAELAALIAALRQEGSPRLYLNHCTGDSALRALCEAFGERVVPCPAGTVLDL